MINVWLLELLVLNSPWGQGGNDLSDFLGLAHLSLVYIMLTDSLSLPLPCLPPSLPLSFFSIFFSSRNRVEEKSNYQSGLRNVWGFFNFYFYFILLYNIVLVLNVFFNGVFF